MPSFVRFTQQELWRAALSEMALGRILCALHLFVEATVWGVRTPDSSAALSPARSIVEAKEIAMSNQHAGDGEWMYQLQMMEEQLQKAEKHPKWVRAIASLRQNSLTDACRQFQAALTEMNPQFVVELTCDTKRWAEYYSKSLHLTRTVAEFQSKWREEEPDLMQQMRTQAQNRARTLVTAAEWCERNAPSTTPPETNAALERAVRDAVQRLRSIQASPEFVVFVPHPVFIPFFPMARVASLRQDRSASVTPPERQMLTDQGSTTLLNGGKVIMAGTAERPSVFARTHSTSEELPPEPSTPQLLVSDFTPHPPPRAIAPRPPANPQPSAPSAPSFRHRPVPPRLSTAALERRGSTEVPGSLKMGYSVRNARLRDLLHEQGTPGVVPDSLLSSVRSNGDDSEKDADEETALLQAMEKIELRLSRRISINRDVIEMAERREQIREREVQFAENWAKRQRSTGAPVSLPAIAPAYSLGIAAPHPPQVIAPEPPPPIRQRGLSSARAPALPAVTAAAAAAAAIVALKVQQLLREHQQLQLTTKADGVPRRSRDERVRIQSIPVVTETPTVARGEGFSYSRAASVRTLSDSSSHAPLYASLRNASIRTLRGEEELLGCSTFALGGSGDFSSSLSDLGELSRELTRQPSYPLSTC